MFIVDGGGGGHGKDPRETAGRARPATPLGLPALVIATGERERRRAMRISVQAQRAKAPGLSADVPLTRYGLPRYPLKGLLREMTITAPCGPRYASRVTPLRPWKAWEAGRELDPSDVWSMFIDFHRSFP